MNLKLFFSLMTICGVVNAQNPTADFGCSIQSFDTTIHNCCIRFEDLSTDNDGSVLSQVWDFGDPASGTANYSTAHFTGHCYSNIGVYSVTFSVLDNDSNVDTLKAINSIVVDSFGCYCNYATNISDINGNLNLFQILPNPTSGQFLVKSGNSKALGEVKIFDMQGRIIYLKEHIVQMACQVDERFVKGIYIVVISSGGGSLVQKLIVD